MCLLHRYYHSGKQQRSNLNVLHIRQKVFVIKANNDFWTGARKEESHKNPPGTLFFPLLILVWHHVSLFAVHLSTPLNTTFPALESRWLASKNKQPTSEFLPFCSLHPRAAKPTARAPSRQTPGDLRSRQMWRWKPPPGSLPAPSSEFKKKEPQTHRKLI